jgi:hypothetical protein
MQGPVRVTSQALRRRAHREADSVIIESSAVISTSSEESEPMVTARLGQMVTLDPFRGGPEHWLGPSLWHYAGGQVSLSQS